MADETARAVMEQHGIDPVAIAVFERQVEHLRSGASTLVPDSELEPYDSPALGSGGTDVRAARPPGDRDDRSGRDGRLDRLAVIRLNGGLGTSMGMDRAKSLLPVRGDRTFLDLIVEQILHRRRTSGAMLPLTFLHSFRTSADTLAVLGRTPDLVAPTTPAVPVEMMQNRVPRLLRDGLRPVSWPDDPEREWCPPGHGDLYTVLHANGLLDTLSAAGFDHVFVANSDNLGAVPDETMVDWFHSTGASFAVEAVRRTAGDRKGGHFARRRRDGRLVLRETAQTPRADLESIGKHRFASTNNLWFRIDPMRDLLERSGGDLHLPVIANEKRVVPGDDDTPLVVQLETAMGSAIERFDDAVTVEVGRDRFIPVKTTDDLLVVRSDCHRLGPGARLEQTTSTLPFVELADCYRHVGELDRRFPAGPPSLVDATSLIVRGDWTFGADVRVVGDVELGPDGGHVADGSVLEGRVG